MQAAMSAMPQEREGRKRLTPELPNLPFGSSKGGGDNFPLNREQFGDHLDASGNVTEGSGHCHSLMEDPSVGKDAEALSEAGIDDIVGCAPDCLMRTSYSILSASCAVEPSFHSVWEGDYSFVYSHLGPECGYSPSSFGTAPCSYRIRVPTSDIQATSEDEERQGSEEEDGGNQLGSPSARGALNSASEGKEEGSGAAPRSWQVELLPQPRIRRSPWLSHASSLLVCQLNAGTGGALSKAAQVLRALVTHGGLWSHLRACRGRGTQPEQLCA